MTKFKKYLALLLACTLVSSVAPLQVFASDSTLLPMDNDADDATSSGSLNDETVSSGSFKPGDVNGDNEVNYDDAYAIMDNVLYKTPFAISSVLSEDDSVLVADFDGNGILTANDVSYILNYAPKPESPLKKSEQTITVQPTASNATLVDGKSVVYCDDFNSTVDLDINLSGVEATMGVNNYTFYVTYNPEVVQLTDVNLPETETEAAKYMQSGNGDMYNEIYIQQSISYIPSADDPEYADVIGDKSENTLTCAELGKVKLSNQNGDGVANNSGILCSLSFKVLSYGDANIGIDVSPEYVDGFNSEPKYGLNYTTNIIDSDIQTASAINKLDAIKITVDAPESMSMLDNSFTVSVNLDGAPPIAGGTFRLKIFDNDYIGYVKDIRLGEALENKGFITEISEGSNISCSFAGTKDVDCNGTLLYITIETYDIGTFDFSFCGTRSKYNRKPLKMSFSDAAQNDYVPDVYWGASTTVTYPTDKQVLGDVNYDGFINNVDATLVLRLGKQLPNYEKAVADVNSDSAIDYKDAMLILNKAAGYDSF